MRMAGSTSLMITLLLIAGLLLMPLTSICFQAMPLEQGVETHTRSIALWWYREAGTVQSNAMKLIDLDLSYEIPIVGTMLYLGTELTANRTINTSSWWGVGEEGNITTSFDRDNYLLTVVLDTDNYINMTMAGVLAWAVIFNFYAGIGGQRVNFTGIASLTFNLNSSKILPVANEGYSYTSKQNVSTKVGYGKFLLRFLMDDKVLFEGSVDFDLYADFVVNYNVDSSIVMELYVDGALMDKVTWAAPGTEKINVSGYAEALVDKPMSLKFIQDVDSLKVTFSNIKLRLDIDDAEFTSKITDWVFKIIEEYLFDVPSLVELLVTEFIKEYFVSPLLEAIERYLTFKLSWMLKRVAVGRLMKAVTKQAGGSEQIDVSVASQSVAITEFHMTIPSRYGALVLGIGVIAVIVAIIIGVIAAITRKGKTKAIPAMAIPARPTYLYH